MSACAPCLFDGELMVWINWFVPRTTLEEEMNLSILQINSYLEKKVWCEKKCTYLFYQTNKCQSTIEYYNAYVHFWNKIIQINAFSQTSVVAYDMNYILAQFILEKFKKKTDQILFLGYRYSFELVVCCVNRGRNPVYFDRK